MTRVRVRLPVHLQTLAGAGPEVALAVGDRPTISDVLSALEERYPALRGTIREHATLQRRAFIRYIACEQDLSHQPQDTPLPAAVVSGREPFRVLGAIAGG
jgi:molybdopterin converting factor small subunit